MTKIRLKIFRAKLTIIRAYKEKYIYICIADHHDRVLVVQWL